MGTPIANDPEKNIVIYINDFYPEFATAFTKLSERLGRPLRGILLVDAGLNGRFYNFARTW